MALIQLDPNEIIDFIPQRFRGEKEPLIVRCKYVNRSLFLQYTDRMAERMRGVEIENRLAIERLVNKEQFQEQVVEVLNYYAPDGKTPITDPGEFYEKEDAELIGEVLDAMMRKAELLKGQAKNFGVD